MIKFDFNKCDFNNFDNYLSTAEVLEYANSNEIAYDFVTVNNACKCENTEFELYKFYAAINDDCNEFFDDECDATEKYDNDDNTEIFEVQIYYCPECKNWCIDYTNI